MPRFLLVRGRQGVLVTNPHAIGASPMRVAGTNHNKVITFHKPLL
jgi:hypothetical protein